MIRHAGMPAFVLSALLGLGVVPSTHAGPAVVEKNLFSPERRPPSAPEIALTGRGQEQAIVVLGIVVIGSSSPSALIRFRQGRPMNGQTGPKHLLVRAGDQVGDYQVHRIDSGGLILERGEKRYAVPLSREGNVAPVSAGSGHEEAKEEQPEQQDPPAEKPAQ
ncbi:MAG: hypothetical protein RBR18_15580 [Desulfovibrionaceae bacterium]|nr:hypothetical protein [Desulfovibrionaceae bacterium]